MSSSLPSGPQWDLSHQAFPVTRSKQDSMSSSLPSDPQWDLSPQDRTSDNGLLEHLLCTPRIRMESLISLIA